MVQNGGWRAQILNDFPSVHVPLEALLEAAPKLQPRQFSISSSPLAHAGRIHLTVAVVDFRTPYKRRVRGLCSSWLASLHAGCAHAPCIPHLTPLVAHALRARRRHPRLRISTQRVPLSPGGETQTSVESVMLCRDCVPVWIERGAFRLPPPDVPLICVGPGTGVAPLRGFLHHRSALKEAGESVAPSVLVFGCRYEARDYLYRGEWEELQRQGVLAGQHGVLCAFSRDGERKVYVQDRIRESAAVLWPLLFESGACVFVAGSANSMPAAVAGAFEGVIAQGMACGDSEAARLRAQLERARRYHVEAWS